MRPNPKDSRDRGRRWRTRAVIAAALSLAGLRHDGVVLAANPVRLNGTLVAGGNVSGFALTPDGSRVIYFADQTTNNVTEIFSVPTAGGTAIKLNPPLVAGGNVFARAAFSPDSTQLVYLAAQETAGVYELFSVPAAGGAVVTLNGPLVAGGTVSTTGLQFTPDGARVIYHADEDVKDQIELFSVRPTGGIATKLNGPMAPGGSVQVSNATSAGRVVYVADQTTNNVLELFSVPSTGGTALKLNPTLVTGGNVTSTNLGPQVSPDGSRVLYHADQSTDEVFELFSVPSTGGTPVKLNGALVAGGDVVNFGYRFSPDGSRVIYAADQVTDNVVDLFSVPAAGGTSVKLNTSGGTVAADGNISTPDGSRVVYLSHGTISEVFIVPITGGTSLKLNGPLVSGGNVTSRPVMNGNGSRIVYPADQITNGVIELFSVSTAGGTPVKLSGPMVAGGDATTLGLQFSPDDTRVLYLADQNQDEQYELFLVPATGGIPRRVNAPLVAGGSVSSAGITFTPDGARVIYSADQNTDGTNEVFTRIVRLRFEGAGGSWDSSANWDQNVVPDDMMQVVIDRPGVVTVTGGNTPRVFDQLYLGGGGGASTLELRSDAVISAINGIVIAAGGVLRGDGVVDVANNTMTNPTTGEIRVGGGERLRIVSSTFLNQGRIEVIGTSAAQGEIEFSSALVNAVATGEISARDAILRFNGGLTNAGAVNFSFGTSDIIGPIGNLNNGKIIVSGNSRVTFYDNINNNSGGELRISAGSTAIFFGPVSNLGTISGGGTKIFEGGGSGLGGLATAGSTIVEAAASVNATFIREDSLTINGIVVINTSGGASHLNELNIAADGVLDLKNNSLVLEGGDLAVITRQIRTGLYEGPGIISSAPGSPFRLGSMSNTGTVYSTFQGISGLDGDEVLIRYTRIGDLNLDGMVTISDFIDLASHFNTIGGATWQMGDVNYDGSVTISDFIDLASNFNQSVSGEASPISGSDAAMLGGFAASNGASAVPEPTCLLVIPVAASLIFRRTRKLPLARSAFCGVP